MSVQGLSLRAMLEDAGVTQPRPFLAEYHQFVFDCRAQNPASRPTVSLYVRAVKENSLRLLTS